MHIIDKKVRIIDMEEIFAPVLVFESTEPIIVQLAGISYCDSGYKVNHPNSPVACLYAVFYKTNCLSIDFL